MIVRGGAISKGRVLHPSDADALNFGFKVQGEAFAPSRLTSIEPARGLLCLQC